MACVPCGADPSEDCHDPRYRTWQTSKTLFGVEIVAHDRCVEDAFYRVPESRQVEEAIAAWLRAKRSEIEAVFASDEQSRAARATLTLVIDHIERGLWRTS